MGFADVEQKRNKGSSFFVHLGEHRFDVWRRWKLHSVPHLDTVVEEDSIRAVINDVDFAPPGPSLSSH